MKPQVTPLAYWHRKAIFLLLLLAFLFSLPAFMFYATGYRYDFFSGGPSITATGGLYIAAEALDSTIFVDETEVLNARVFRNASYIQGLIPSQHRVHVQAPGLHTWVKNLTVYPHIVTEAEAFNLPLIPQVRPITSYQTQNGEAVFMRSTSTPAFLLSASSTIQFVATSSTATSSYRMNPEHALISDLFLVKASTTKEESEPTEAFSFSTSTPIAQPEVATTTIISNNITLFERDGMVFVSALGEGRQIPHYFCTSQIEIDAALKLEEAPVNAEEELLFENTLSELSNNTRECRTEIKMDTLGQKMIDFTFFPGSEDLVLLHLERGLYVVEVDDRAWQNAQPLYLGDSLTVLVNSGNIFVKDGQYLMEVQTELPIL